MEWKVEKVSMHFTPEQRAKIGKYAAECGNKATVSHFDKEFSWMKHSKNVQKGV